MSQTVLWIWGTAGAMFYALEAVYLWQNRRVIRLRVQKRFCTVEKFDPSWMDERKVKHGS